MSSLNKVIIAGNVTRKPEVRHVGGNNTALTEVGVALNRRTKRGDEWTDETTFVDVTLWGRTAEVAAEYLDKGSQIVIEGRLQMDQWEDKETGKKRYKLGVVGENMQMMGSRGGGGGQQSQPSSEPRPAPARRASADEIPF
jgi:single-strand DNA-binding protein